MRDENLKREINSLFEIMEGLSDSESKARFTEYVLASIEEQTANNKNFYEDDHEWVRQTYKENMFTNLNTEHEEIFDLVSKELESPFSIFIGIFNQDIPDMLISSSSIKIQYNKKEFDDVEIPTRLRPIFSRFLMHIINQQKYINEMKFDKGKENAIQDLSFGRFRMNFVHPSLSVFNSPLITIRKHVANVDGFKEAERFDREAYKKGLGVSEELLDKIIKYSKSSFIIFGDTGSGKTTLLRYLIQDGLENKRNCCIIEDTAELFINTSISLLTNENYTIHDLFIATLRQNPSDLVIGETRNDEIVDILEASLTFPVSTTIHAKSFRRAIERIYRMSSSRKISKEDLHDIISASVDMFIHMENREIKGVWVRNKKSGKNIYELYDALIGE